MLLGLLLLFIILNAIPSLPYPNAAPSLPLFAIISVFDGICTNPFVLDVFHWSCLHDLAARLPLNTAPAGYQCPTCQGPVFPPSNLASPIADMLREQLSLVNWARAGLGLPLVSYGLAVWVIQD